MKYKTIISMLAMLLLVAGMVSAFTVSGTVTGSGVGTLAGANVSAYNYTTGDYVNSTLSDGSGNYVLVFSDTFTAYDFNVSAPTYQQPSKKTVLVNSDMTVDFILGPQSSVNITGYVTDNSTSGPLNNVEVSVKQGGATFTETSTNAAGFYSVSVIDGQVYDVSASLLDYITESSSVTINNATELNFSLAPVSTLTCTDDDGDGYAIEGGDCGLADCDDNNPFVNPGATETGNGIDDDCDGSIDEGFYTPPNDDDDDDDDDSRSSSSGSRITLYQIPIIYEEEFDSNGEIIKELFRINILKFPIGGDIHQLEVVNVFVDKATLIISSVPITFSLNIGHGKEFDLTGDGVNDVSVTLLERIHSRVVVKLKLLNHPAGTGSTSSSTTDQTTTDSGSNEQTTITTGAQRAKIVGSFLLVDFLKATKGGLYITLGTILVGLVVYFIFFRPKMIQEQAY